MQVFNNKTQSNIINGIIVFLLISFFFFPPASPALTLLLAIFSISFSENKWQTFKGNWKEVLLFSGLFWVYLFGMLYTENTEKGWLNVTLKFSFLAYPLIFGLINPRFIQRKQLMFLLSMFILITTSSVLFSLGHAAFEYLAHQDYKAFYYARLSYLIHPSYYALYVNFALIAVICRLIISKQVKTQSAKIALWLLIPLFLVFLILLESKAGLLGLISVLGLSLLHLIITEKRINDAIKLFVVSVLSIGITLIVLPQTTSRVNQVVESMEKEESATEHSATAARIYLWEAAFKSFLEKPVFGHGPGDTKKELFRQYEIQNNTRAIEHNYNPHNQYLETMVATGVLGLISLLSFLFYPLLFSHNRKIPFYFLLAFLMAINLLVESMFERQAGVMFFAFFNSLLFFFYKSQEKLDKSIT